MATLKTRDIETSLLRKGFGPKDGDHKFFVYYIGEKKTRIFTKISHGKTEISDPLISAMGKQVHLNKSEFIDLINCPLTKERYQKMMIDGGYIKF